MKNNKKVGIVTLCGNNNYGNKLQNFAVLFYVSKMDYNVETIWICNPFLDNPIKQILKYFKKVMYENNFSYPHFLSHGASVQFLF